MYLSKYMKVSENGGTPSHHPSHGWPNYSIKTRIVTWGFPHVGGWFDPYVSLVITIKSPLNHGFTLQLAGASVRSGSTTSSSILMVFFFPWLLWPSENKRPSKGGRWRRGTPQNPSKQFQIQWKNAKNPLERVISWDFSWAYHANMTGPN